MVQILLEPSEAVLVIVQMLLVMAQNLLERSGAVLVIVQVAPRYGSDPSGAVGGRPRYCSDAY